jgi:hypothetical protein
MVAVSHRSACSQRTTTSGMVVSEGREAVVESHSYENNGEQDNGQQDGCDAQGSSKSGP